MHTQITRKLSALEEPDGASGTAPWAIVLAGGAGVRLRPLVRQLCGDERPKQFAKIVGSKSLLRQTLDRVNLKIPPVRTVISACRPHAEYLAKEFAETPAQRILVQPQDRGTAAGILFPAHWIYSQDPEAVVSIFPADPKKAPSCAISRSWPPSSSGSLRGSYWSEHRLARLRRNMVGSSLANFSGESTPIGSFE